MSELVSSDFLRRVGVPHQLGADAMRLRCCVDAWGRKCADRRVGV
jgi:hypothetical protein